MKELQERLTEIITSPASMKEEVELAEKLSKKIRLGIVPSPKSLNKLYKLSVIPTECAHMQHDGSCGWLRKHGEGYGIPLPAQGFKAKCAFPTRVSKCPGFKKVK